MTTTAAVPPAVAPREPQRARRTWRARMTTVLWPRSYLPWQGPATRTDKVLMWAFGGVILLALAIRPFKPFLIASHPVLLELLTGDPIAIGVGAAFARVGEASLWLVVLAGAVGMVKLDWLTWWAGRRWGAGMMKMFTTRERAQRFADRATELNPWIMRSAVLVAVMPGVPTPVVYAMAGWAGMRLVTFLVLNLVGAVIMTGLIAGLGYRLGQSAVDLVLLIDKYATMVSLTMLGVALLVPVVKRWIRRTGVDAH